MKQVIAGILIAFMGLSLSGCQIKIQTETDNNDSESTPIVVDPTPEVEDPTPIVVDPIPEVEEPAPIVVDPIPEVEEPAPIVVDPTPTPEDDPTPVVIVPGALNLELSLEESAGVNWGKTNIRSGVPFIRGQISQSDSLILSRNGNQVPLAHRPLSLWDDGSVRWMLLDTQFNLNANSRETLTLTTGQPMSVNNSITVTQNSDYFTLDTGVIKAEIPKKNGSIINRIWHQGDLVISPDTNLTNRGPYIQVSDIDSQAQSTYFGGLLTSASQPHSSGNMSNYRDLNNSSGYVDFNSFDPFNLDVSIEEANPLHTVVRVSGAHLNADGKAFSTFILRLHFYAGQSRIDVDHTLVYTGTANEQVVSYGFKLPFSGQETRLDGQSVANAELLHTSYRNYKINGSSRSGQSFGSISRDNGTKQVSIILRDMAEKFPKALVASSNALDVQLYPESVQDWNLAKYSPDPADSDYQNEDPSAPNYDLLAAEIATKRGETRRRYFDRGAQGFSVSDNYSMFFDPTNTANTIIENRARTIDEGSLRLMPEARYISDASVMGVGPFAFDHQLSKSEGHFRVDRVLQVIEDFMRLNQRKEFDWFGMEDYGDIRGLFYGGKGASYTWSGKGRYGWSGNSGEPSNQLWIQYLRKPSQQLFRDAEALARHTLDQQTVHFSDLSCGSDSECEAAGYALNGQNKFSSVGSIHRHGVQSWSGYAGSADYSHVAGVETYYYLTGDARAKEVLYEQAHYIMRQYSDKTGLKNGLDVLDRAIAVHFNEPTVVDMFETRAQEFIQYMAEDKGYGWNGVEARLIDYNGNGRHDRDSEGDSNRQLFLQSFEFFMRSAPGMLYRHERLQEPVMGELILDAANILTKGDGDDWNLGLDGHAGSYFYHMNTLAYATHIAPSLGYDEQKYYQLTKRSIENNTHAGNDTHSTAPFSLATLEAFPEEWSDWQWRWDEDDQVAIGDPGILWLARQVSYSNNYLQDYHSYRAFIHLATAAAAVETGQMQLR